MKVIGSQFKRTGWGSKVVWESGSILVPRDMFVTMSNETHARDMQLVYGKRRNPLTSMTPPMSDLDCPPGTKCINGKCSEYNVTTISYPSIIKSIIIFK